MVENIMDPLILILAILVIVGIFLNARILSRLSQDDDSQESDKLDDISEKLETQKYKLEQQIESLSGLSKGLSEFNYPLKQITRYLSGGTLAGTFGEWGLGSIVRDILPSNKLKENHEIVEGTGERVEFAIMLDNGLLPIDAKFPSALYDTYIEASEREDQTNREEVNRALRALKRKTKENAQEISEKYIHQGITIDFGVMFIPSESLMQLIDRFEDDGVSVKEQLFRDYRVLILGPNSLAAFLVSLNMGFKTVVLNEKAQEILKIYGDFEKEFRQFKSSTSDVKDKASKVVKAMDQNEVRIRAMERVMKKMDDLTTDDET